MNIDAAPDRLLRIADELSISEQNLRYAAGSIEEVISSLKGSEEEPVRIMAAGLQKTLERTESRRRTIAAMSAALIKIADIYSRTEAAISDHGDAALQQGPVKVLPQDLRPVKERTDGLFEKL